MAISPNDTFTSGQILTAQECNQFPFGIVGFAEKTSNTTGGSEAVVLSSSSFTAIANRYYKATVFVASIGQNSGAAVRIAGRIRKGTTTAGSQLMTAESYLTATGDDDKYFTMQWVGTLTAGAQQISFTFESASATTLLAGATFPLQIVIEDIGLA